MVQIFEEEHEVMQQHNRHFQMPKIKLISLSQPFVLHIGHQKGDDSLASLNCLLTSHPGRSGERITHKKVKCLV